MIKKLIVLIGVAFVVIVGAGKVNADTVTHKTGIVKAEVEVVSRNIERHTINVTINDDDTDKITLKNVSSAQMDVANKGSIIKVTYDDKFNLSSIEKVSDSNDSGLPEVDGADMVILVPLAILLIFTALVAMAVGA